MHVDIRGPQMVKRAQPMSLTLSYIHLKLASTAARLSVGSLRTFPMKVSIWLFDCTVFFTFTLILSQTLKKASRSHSCSHKIASYQRQDFEASRQNLPTGWLGSAIARKAENICAGKPLLQCAHEGWDMGRRFQAWLLGLAECTVESVKRTRLP